MENIVVCLQKIVDEYEVKTSELKNIISSSPKEKLILDEKNYFLMHFVELRKYIEYINDLDEKFYENLNLLHDSWMEDHDRIYYLCVSGKKGLLSRKKISIQEDDKLDVYCDDLEITTQSIKNVIKGMNTKISSFQIQEFLK